MVSYRFECTDGEHLKVAKTIRARDDIEAMRIALEERTQACALWRGDRLIAKLDGGVWTL